MITRDREIYDFIELVGICTAKQIKQIFLPNTDISQTYKRLKHLVDKGFIKCYKIGLNNYYYTNKRTSKKMLEHDLKTTEIVGYLKSNGANIIDFKRNKIIGRTLKDFIFADGYIVYKIKLGDKTFKRHILIEVQRSIQFKPNPNYGHLYSCVNKYNHSSVKDGLIELNREYGFKKSPPLIVVTDIRDTTTQLFTTKLLKVPYTKNQEWGILIR